MNKPTKNLEFKSGLESTEVSFLIINQQCKQTVEERLPHRLEIKLNL